MKYVISYSNPHNHYIDIEFIAENINQDELTVHLPTWRPGRYELGNFAKNIQKWGVFDSKGTPLAFQKLTKDSWKIQTKNVSTLHIRYNYFSNDLTAGSTLLDENQLYMNPVNCCVYITERIDHPCVLQIHTPDTYRVAIGAEVESTNGVHTCKFDNYHDLADSPYIASDSLQHNSYMCNGVEFHIWIQGECRPDWIKTLADFEKFTQAQFDAFNAFPNKAYHFLIHVAPQRAYHGVEHKTSTVILLGPGFSLMQGNTYEDLLGICSHELYHVWNVKTIRPIEMQPYDYTQENYSKLGYVCEGVTTYYGDYFLFTSGTFTENQYFKTFNERLQTHYDNFGRYNLSVADSSFDTWLDGYEKGVPNRKTSIYGEGCLMAFITDVFIRRNSANKYSLDDVMRYLYNEFALKGKGYSDIDYKNVVEKYAAASFDIIFTNYINQARDYSELLHEAMDYIGCKLTRTKSSNSYENKLGIKIADANGTCKVLSVVPHSTADKAGVSIGDLILAINDMQIRPETTGTNFSGWCDYYTVNASEITLTLSTTKQLKTIKIALNDEQYYSTMRIQKSNSATAEQKENFKLWSANVF
jgi:predicted metalloprotease with PDZ domain